MQACARAVVDHPADASLTHLLQIAEEQRAARTALRSNDRAASDAYLVLYPTGRFADDVKQHLERLATLNPAPTPAITPAPLVEPQPPAPIESPKPKVDPVEIARVLQVELKRVGCDPGSLDGNWAPSSQRALERYNQETHGSLKVTVATVDAIDEVRSKPDKVWPVRCRDGESLQDN